MGGMWLEPGSCQVRVRFESGSCLVRVQFESGSCLVRVRFESGSCLIRIRFEPTKQIDYFLPIIRQLSLDRPYPNSLFCSPINHLSY